MLRGILKARPAVAATRALARVCVPARTIVDKIDTTYVPSVEELESPGPVSRQYEMLREKEKHIARTELLSDDDPRNAEWVAELNTFMYTPTSLREQTIPARPRMRILDEYGCAQAKGSRKAARAYVHLKPGTGSHIINGMPYSEYFMGADERVHALEPLLLTGLSSQMDTFVEVSGGGRTGQSGAIRHALANALQSMDPGLRPLLKPAQMLRRDPRNVERKKTGFAKARKRFAFVKR